MAKDLRMLDAKSLGIVDEIGDEDEIVLELSIGGIFGKSKKLTNRNENESVQKDNPDEAMNVQSKREIQALRRRELRRKREEKLKKSVGFGSCGSVSGPFVENKEWLERQIVGQNDDILEIEPAIKKERIGNIPENVGSIAAARVTNGSVRQIAMPVCGGGQVVARIIRQNDDILEIETARKKERLGNSPENVGSIAAALVTNGSVSQVAMPVCGGGQVVARVDEDMNMKSSVFRPTACGSFRPYQGNRYLKSVEDEIEGGGGRQNGKVISNGSGGCASSAFSDSQCSSRQGGATDDSRSNSSNSQLDQQLPSTSAASDPLEPSDQPTGSSRQTGSTTGTMPTDSTVSESTPLKPNDQLSPPEPRISNPPPKLDTSNQQVSFLARMPCVSTTGNGPNGKTVSGFLYRYTKNEVSIVCVCHGSLFSPAGFVEHAGGVDIVHPLKHITILPTAFAP